MKAIRFIILLCIALSFFGCKKLKVDDPVGTVTLNMRNADNGNTSLDLCTPDDKVLCHVHINNSNNFGTTGWPYYSSEVKFVRVDADCLADVTTLPSSGWSNTVAVTPGDGYIVKVTCTSENTPYYGNTYYCRIYVTSWTTSATNGGIIGAEIKYQYPMPIN